MKFFLKKVYKSTIGFLLNFIASLCYMIFTPLSFILSFIFTWWNETLSYAVNKLNKQQESLAVCKDVLLGIMLAPFLNVILIKKDSNHKFGMFPETISYVIGKNDEENTLTKYGIKWRDRLNRIDKDHCKNAVISFELKYNKKVQIN